MSSSQIGSLIFICFVATLLMVIGIYLLSRRFALAKGASQKESNGYGIWYAGTIVSAGLVAWQTITLIKETMENVYQQTLVLQSQLPISPFWICVKHAMLLLGIGAMWFVLWYYIAMACTKLVVGDKDDREEMMAFNASYFLIRAGLHIGLSIAFMPFLSTVLRAFLPQTVVTFYH